MRRAPKIGLVVVSALTALLIPSPGVAQSPGLEVPVSIGLEIDQPRPGEAFDAVVSCGTDEAVVPVDLVTTPPTVAATLAAQPGDQCRVDAAALVALGATVSYECEATGDVTCDAADAASATVGADGGTVAFTIVARFPVETTTTTAKTASAADVPAVCAFLLELDAGVAALGDPTADTAASTVAQLDAVIPLFEEAATKAPPEVAGDLEGLAAGFTEIRAIVAEIEAQGSQPTAEQMQQLQSIEELLGPFVEGLATWADANCAGPAPAVDAAPSFTG